MTARTVRIGLEDTFSVEINDQGTKDHAGNPQFDFSISGGGAGFGSLHNLTPERLQAIGDAISQTLGRALPDTPVSTAANAVRKQPAEPEPTVVFPSPIPKEMADLLKFKADLDRQLAEYEIKWEVERLAGGQIITRVIQRDDIRGTVDSFEEAYLWTVEV